MARCSSGSLVSWSGIGEQLRSPGTTSVSLVVFSASLTKTFTSTAGDEAETVEYDGADMSTAANGQQKARKTEVRFEWCFYEFLTGSYAFWILETYIRRFHGPVHACALISN